MARRSGTIPDDFALLSRWIDVILAALVYLSFKYSIPSASFQNLFYKFIAKALPSPALLAGGLRPCKPNRRK